MPKGFPTPNGPITTEYLLKLLDYEEHCQPQLKKKERSNET